MPPMKALWCLLTCASAMVSGCSHSDPVGAGISYQGDQPHRTDDPVQLTFSPSVDGRPVYSRGGTWLAYAAGRGTAQRQDLCLAVLPGGGGQQRLNHCLDVPDSTHRIEAVEYAAMHDDGRVTFIRNIGLSGGFGSIASELLITDIDSRQAPRKLLDLGRFFPGVSGRVDYLLGMTWTGPNEITAMATTAQIGEQCQFCPIDTLYTGSQVVRFRTDQAQPALQVVAGAAGASRMAVDVGARQIYLLHGTTISRMPIDGGEMTTYHIPPPRPGTVSDTVSSIAAGGGLVFYARHTITLVSNIRTESHAIYQVEDQGNARVLFTGGNVQLGDYLTATDDGRRIAFEATGHEGRNIFRIEVAP